MQDVHAIHAINAEQLVTATDRLLLRHGQPRHLLARGSQARIAPLAVTVRGTRPYPAQTAIARRDRELPRDERTLVVRPATAHRRLFALSAVIPALASIALGLAVLLSSGSSPVGQIELW